MGMADFSLTLNEDQLQIQKWVHDFAESVVRPAGHEWDEREEFPWPIVEEAAKIGLYGTDFLLNAISDPTGLTLPVAVEELFWGDAGIGMAIMGSGLAAAGISGNGTPEQVMEWVPQCYGTPDKVALVAFCVSEPDAGSDVSGLRTRAVYDEANDDRTGIIGGSEPGVPGTWRFSIDVARAWEAAFDAAVTPGTRKTYERPSGSWASRASVPRSDGTLPGRPTPVSVWHPMQCSR